ncbi:T9SS type A sorting domain-containing protein [Winogradskyella sediminis]|uniref:T9SS type A sorting domain-containing protein n=1 Tax=Winogradskyella sediminis TaxID=1382466 RepID=UPI003AA9AB6D
MKKITFLLFALIAISFNTEAFGQCGVDTAEGPYTNFNTSFGGAPCDAGSGSPTNELPFAAWADEAYLMDNVVLGYTYTFSLCNGDGAGSWTPSFTIIAPSGAVDAIGLDDGSTCALTWTATEEGTYIIVISEEGVACGTSTNNATDNGFPAITGTDGETCPVCEELFPPSCTSVISPADNAINVVSEENITDGIVSREVLLSWDPVEGADGYAVSFGGDVLGETAGTQITLYGLDFETTYTWSILPINCAGTATSCATWTFTTDSALSINEDKFEAFSVYPNPTSGILNIKSTQNIDSINVFNLLGQNVASFSKNAIIDSSIDLSDLSNGLYLVKITAGENTETLRVTKE